VAFIDEIFKANSAILNALLTILNERLFDNGSERGKVCAMLCTPCAPPFSRWATHFTVPEPLPDAALSVCRACSGLYAPTERGIY
jgi:MoxR-like ATPase